MVLCCVFLICKSVSGLFIGWLCWWVGLILFLLLVVFRVVVVSFMVRIGMVIGWLRCVLFGKVWIMIMCVGSRFFFMMINNGKLIGLLSLCGLIWWLFVIRVG